VNRPEPNPRKYESPSTVAGYTLSILYILLGGLGLSVDFGEGKYPLLLGIVSLPTWDYLSQAPAFRKAMGAVRWSLILAVSPAVTLYLIHEFLGGFH
jgi:hypothetical protein